MEGTELFPNTHSALDPCVALSATQLGLQPMRCVEQECREDNILILYDNNISPQATCSTWWTAFHKHSAKSISAVSHTTRGILTIRQNTGGKLDPFPGPEVTHCQAAGG